MKLASRDPVLLSRRRDSELLREDLQNDELVLGHAPDGDACRDSSVTHHR